MELKTTYQYTYFIQPFFIEDGKVQKFILKMLREKNCKLKIYDKTKNLGIEEYFLPKVRKFIFPTMELDDEIKKKLEKLPIESKAAELSKYNCNIFEYTLEKDIQGKVDGVEYEQEKGIFFTIPKIDVVCFKNGVGFVLVKTIIEDDVSFSNILNFNYKFRDINKDGTLDSYENIRLQSSNFENTASLKEFISNITGSNIDAKELNIEDKRLITYSYICIDEQAWGATSKFDNIKHYFEKYANILPADSSIEIENRHIETMPRWKYANIGINKLGVMLMASSADINNYTKLPVEYEEQYLYTYVIELYRKMTLRRKLKDAGNLRKIKRVKKELTQFTNDIWYEEITDEEIGTKFDNKIINILELGKLYENVLKKIETMSGKKDKGEKTMKITCGTDIIEISRIKDSIDSLGDKFLNKIFTDKEIKYCESKKGQRYQHYAARFAAKEATFKAISHLLNDKYSICWKDIEVVNNKEGNPSVNILGVNMEYIESVDLSISHCKEYAVANVTVLSSLSK